MLPLQTVEEKLIVWTLLDTGLRVSELCSLTLDNVQWQHVALLVAGKGVLVPLCSEGGLAYVSVPTIVGPLG
jgi:site-specific recombinase XerD